MKDLYTYLYGGAMLLCTSALQAQNRDSLVLDNSGNIGNKFTLEIKDVRFENPEASFKLVLRHAYNTQSVGCDILISPSRITGVAPVGETLLADGLMAPQDTHTYTVIANNAQISVYRDKVLLGKMFESSTTDETGISLVNGNSLAGTYETALTPEIMEPVESDNENHIDNMLPPTCSNLISDPYFNRGFTRTGTNADGRNLFSQQAIYSGWGAEAAIDTKEAWSGTCCLRISGQAIQPTQGASVETTVKFAANTPYYIRAMVKSDGYEGKIGIQSCSGYLHIRDTQGEWKQLEGIFTPKTASETLYINNVDFSNSGTVWIDNLEVYRGYSSTSALGVRREIPYVALTADQHWSPTRASNVYMLGFADNGNEYSTIDTEKVSLMGGRRLTKSVTGSQMYALSFPGPLRGMQVSGWFDGMNHDEEPLYPGVDYVLQRYEYPRFHYVDGQDIPAGCYIVQFVDNLDGQDVTMTFGAPAATTEDTEAPYRLVGNDSGSDYAPEGTFLKFSEEHMKFERTKAESVKPFEAYIATTADAPVYQIVPNGITTGLTRASSADGTRISIQGGREGIIAHSASPCRIDVFTLDGCLVRQQDLHTGHNVIPASPGLYIVSGKKVIVSR